LLIIFSIFFSPFLLAGENAYAQRTEELEMIVITATRHLRNIRDVSSAVSVVTREDFENMPATTILDTLKNSTGVSVVDERGSYGSSSSNAVVIRGMGGDGPARVMIMVDGMPANSPGSGIFEWNSLNMDSVERIEILRGPSSALYGSTAMGGVVNIITRDPRATSGFNTSLKLRYGRYNSQDVSLYHTGSFGKLGYALTAGLMATHGFNAYPRRSPSPSYRFTRAVGKEEVVKNYTAGVKLRYSFDSSTDLSFSADANDYSRTGRYQGGEFDKRDYALYLHKHLSMMVALHKDFRVLDSRAALRVDLIDNDYDSGSSTTLRFTNRAPNKLWSWNFDLTNTMTLGRHTLTFGTSAYWGSQSRRYLYFANPLILRQRGGEQMNFAVFLQDEIAFWDNKLIIIPGLRYDYWRTNGYDYNSQVNVFEDYSWMKNTYLSPKLGLRYDPFDGFFILRANYGEGFRVGTLDDRFGSFPGTGALYIGNNDLDPEVSRTVDLGIELNPTDKWNFSLTAYHTIAKNYIDNVPIDPTGYDPYINVYQKQNIGRVKITGLEGSVNFYPTNYLTFFLNGNITRAVVADGENEGNHIDHTPENKLIFGFNLNKPETINIRMSANWTGKIWQNLEENRRLVEGQVWLFDVRISKKLSFDSFDVEPFLEANNLTTKKEVRFTNSARVPINMVYGGVKFDF
jgi:outer membrane receptor protein involved in Fe transport